MKKLWLGIFIVVAGGLYLQSRPDKETPAPEEQEEFITMETPLEQPTETLVPQPKPIPNLKSQNHILKQPTPPKPSPQAKYPNLDDSFIPFDEQGRRYLPQIVQMGKHLVYHGDVLIGDTKDLPNIKKQKFVKRGKSQKWPDGKVPFVIDTSLPNYDQILEAIDYMNTTTNIQLNPREDEKNYVTIVAGEMDCYSYAGMIGGEQEIFLTPRCRLKEVVHELMHTIGFFHEQNREDRDQYVQILWENIADLHHTQFKKLPNDFIGVGGRPFDLNSIMMYSSFTFSAAQGEPAMITKSGDLIPHSQSLLSGEDIQRVNLAYPR